MLTPAKSLSGQASFALSQTHALSAAVGPPTLRRPHTMALLVLLLKKQLRCFPLVAAATARTTAEAAPTPPQWAAHWGGQVRPNAADPVSACMADGARSRTLKGA